MKKFQKYTYLAGFLVILGVVLCGTEQVIAADPAAPAYTNEQLPFDPFDTSSITTSGLGNTVGYSAWSSSMAGLLDLGSNDPIQVIYGIINIVLTFLGMAFLVLLLYAGVTWVTARGNEEGVTKAKELIKRAVVGLIIILSAYGVSYLLFDIIDLYASNL